MRSPPPLLVALALAGSLAACSRDLDLPAPNAAPVVRSFAPMVAYAGERLVLTGQGFDTNPEGNLVQFAGATARAESASAGTLVVRVPEDAGTGRFTVTTRAGVSAPTVGTFTYLGRGELRAHAVSSALPLLHKPYRVIGLRDDTFLHSDLLLGLVRYEDPAFVAAEAVSEEAVQDPSGAGTVVWLESGVTNDVPWSALVALGVSPAGVTTTTVRADVDYASVGPLAVVRAGGSLATDAVAVFRNWTAMFDLGFPMYTVTLHRLSDLAIYPGWTSDVLLGFEHVLPIADLRGCADAGGGSLACLGREGSGDALTLLRITFDPAESVTVLPPPAGAIVEDRTLPHDPLCAETVTRRVAVALQDGTIGVANMLQPRWAPSPLATGSRTPARALTCLRPGYLDPDGLTTNASVLVSNAGDDLVQRIDLRTGRVIWATSVEKPAEAGVACATGMSCDQEGMLHVASDADNGITLLDLATGALRTRRSRDVLPGRVDNPRGFPDLTAMQGAAWYQSPGDFPRLAFATAEPPGIIEWPLTVQRGRLVFPFFRDRPEAIGAFPWSDRSGYDTLGPSLFATPLLGAAQLAVDAGNTAHFGTTAGLESFDWFTTDSGVSPLTTPSFTSLGVLDDGRVLAALRTGAAAWQVAAWIPADGLLGGPPESTAPFASEVIGAVVLDGRAWAFYFEAGEIRAVALGPDLAPAPGTDQGLGDLFFSIVAVSPNRRTFVSWDFQPFSTVNTTVVIWAVDADGAIARRATIPVAGQVSGADFDGTGEKLYVVTRNPDRVLEIE